MTPADELRAAAETLRSLTGDATDGPWTSEDPNRAWGDDNDHRLIGGGKILATFNSDYNGPLNALYAATMHPGVGTALAKWLDSWVGIDFSEHAAMPGDLAHALAVARAINGGQQ